MMRFEKKGRERFGFSSSTRFLSFCFAFPSSCASFFCSFFPRGFFAQRNVRRGFLLGQRRFQRCFFFVFSFAAFFLTFQTSFCVCLFIRLLLTKERKYR